MRIHEIILEGSPQSSISSYPIRDIFGGGKVTLTLSNDPSGKRLTTITNEFKDNNGNTLVKYEFKNNNHYWYDKASPKGELYHQNTSSVDMTKKFINDSMKIMAEYYGAKLLSGDKDGDRTITLAKNIGKNMNESMTNSNVIGQIRSDLKDFIELSMWAAKNIGNEVSLPKGNFLPEDTTVNMSPYKDSIKNAETPKSKQAKNKISDLTRK